MQPKLKNKHIIATDILAPNNTPWSKGRTHWTSDPNDPNGRGEAMDSDSDREITWNELGIQRWKGGFGWQWPVFVEAKQGFIIRDETYGKSHLFKDHPSTLSIYIPSCWWFFGSSFVWLFCCKVSWVYKVDLFQKLRSGGLIDVTCIILALSPEFTITWRWLENYQFWYRLVTSINSL